MSATLGRAYLAIMPETSSLMKEMGKVNKTLARDFSKVGDGLSKSLSSAIKSVDKVSKKSGKSIGGNLGAGVSSSITSSLSKSLGSISKIATKPLGGLFRGITTGITSATRIAGRSMVTILKGSAATAGAAVAGVMAVSISSGFGRLDAIDQAQSKLRGLGHEADSITKIMESATKSVTGTAMGLGEAVTTAANITASGVKPGMDLTKTLTLIADTATIAGSDMTTMGSIFAKVASSDMIQMDVMNQLLDQGIPILSMLADELDLTTTEVRKMASDGEISFKVFQKALTEGVGGAAQESGNTFRGAFKNMGAALGRFGATALEPFFNTAPMLFGAFGTSFDALNESIAPLSESMERKLTPSVERLSEWVANRLPGAIEDSIPRISTGLENIYGEFNSIRGRLYPVLESVSGSIVSAFTAINPYLPTIPNILGGVYDSLIEYSPQIKEGFGQFSTWVTESLGSIEPHMPTVKDAISWLSENIGKAFTLIQDNAPAIREHFETISGYAKDMGEAIALAFNPDRETTIGEGGGQTVGDFYTFILDQLSLIGPALADIIPPLIDVLGQFGVAFSSVSSEVWTTLLVAISALLPVVVTFIQVLTPLLESLSTWMTNHPDAVKGLIGAFLGFMALKKVIGIISGVTKVIGIAFRMVTPWGLALTALMLLVPLIITHWDTIVDVIKSAWNWIKDAVKWMINLPETIKDAFKSMGKAIGNFFLNPIKDAIDWLKNSMLGKLLGWDKGGTSTKIDIKGIGGDDSGGGGFFGRGLPGPSSGGGSSTFSSGDSLGMIRTASAAGRTMANIDSYNTMTTYNTPATLSGAPGSSSGGLTINVPPGLYTGEEMAQSLSDLASELGIHRTQINQLNRNNSPSANSYHNSNK